MSILKDDLRDDLQAIMDLHSADAGLYIAETGGHRDREDLVRSAQKHILELEGFLAHSRQRITEAAELLRRYEALLSKEKVRTFRRKVA